MKNSRIGYFDKIAHEWDRWHDPSSVAERLRPGLQAFDIGQGEQLLDVGCGTGNLTMALAEIAPTAAIHAIDISSNMIAIAKSKIPSARVNWYVADASSLPLGNGSIDRIFCYSVWPHFNDKRIVTEEFCRVLKPRGLLYVWHHGPRERINAIHATSDSSIRGDELSSAQETARVLESLGLSVQKSQETQSEYCVIARTHG